MPLPTSLINGWRKDYIQKGYALLPSIIPSPQIDTFRHDVSNGCIARKNTMITLPLIDNIVKQQSRIADPLYDKLNAKLKAHKKKMKYLKAQKRLRQGKSLMGDVSGDDVWEISKKVAEALSSKSISSSSSDRSSASSASAARAMMNTSTIENDAMMLSAINKHQANVWMSAPKVGEAIKGDVGKLIGEVVQGVVTGGEGEDESQGLPIDGPGLFADLPVYRESFGRPLSPSFAAYEIGCRTTSNPCTVAWVFTNDHTEARMPITLFERSHIEVAQQYWSRINPRDFSNSFKPMESHIPYHLGMFDFGPDVKATMLYPTKGSVLVCNPHMMVGAGSNYSREPTVIYRACVVGKGAKASMKPPSWISDWRSIAADIDLEADVVFPHLY